jgi:acetone carboxylase gamma subunit
METGAPATIVGMKECPMCGTSMRLDVREIRDTIPGGQTKVRVMREWICPECDYFEEAETGEG